VTTGSAPVVSIAASSTTAPGAVQLYNNVDSTSTTLALTAAQGKNLQDQITALALNPSISLAGTINADTGGIIESVTSAGATAGYVVGNTLPAADATTVATSGGTANFTNLQIKQGIPAVYTYTVNSTTNPKYVFEIPDSKIDTTSIQVTVQENSSNTSYTTYQPAGSFLTLTPTDQVYFLQESLNGNYQISFGDGVLGYQLQDGNIVVVSYISTDGTMASGANSFVLMDNIGGFTSSSVSGVIPASQGGDKESIDSIKFQAPKAYAAQNRAVTKEDYITAIQQNNLGFAC
jgi:hypothetical protein